MTRAELIRRLILNSISDDFENVDQVILRDVAEVAAKCGLIVERPEVVENLGALVAAGLAKAYDLSATTGNPFSGELQGMPPLDAPEENFRTYFHSTQKGLGSTIGMERGGRLTTMTCFVRTGSRHDSKGDDCALPVSPPIRDVG